MAEPSSKYLDPVQRKLLEKQQYSFTGKNSAVKICSWTKKSILSQGSCYKEKFYGIKSHLCCQMSPSVGFCTSQCIHCWREMEFTSGRMDQSPDTPDEIIKNSILAQRKQLSGLFGNEKADKKKLNQAQNPKHFAISLTGEPFIYPYLGELIQKLHKLGKTTFLVTNGQFPEKISSLPEMPTQLYVSLSASNEKDFNKLCSPSSKQAWKKLMKTLALLPRLKTRTVLRITLMKGINMSKEHEYAELIKKAKPAFIEAKSYMFVGSSRSRLTMKNMPLHNEVIDFARKTAELSGYILIDQKKESRVALLAQLNKKHKSLQQKIPEKN